MEWQNPHNWYYVDVKDANGSITHWAAEGAPPGHLFRDGVERTTLTSLVGSTVTVEGAPARDGSKNMSAHKMTLPDGKNISHVVWPRLGVQLGISASRRHGGLSGLAISTE